MTIIEKTTLSAHVREALKQWGNDVSAQSSLRHLASFRRLQLEQYSKAAMVQPDSERQIANRFLHNAILRLQEAYEVDAQLLQLRYLENWPIQRLSHHYKVAESTLYVMQRQAIERLVEIVAQLEDEATVG